MEVIPCYEVTFGQRAAGLAPDSCGSAAPAVPPGLAGVASGGSSNLWLPQGHHWDLHIEHDHRITTGPFVGGAGAIKWTWHITVSPWETVDSMRDVLHDKSAEVHFVIGGRRGVEHPVVIQCLPLNQYGKGLVHQPGTAETNRARTIQCEICAMPGDMSDFAHYRALANLFSMCTHGSNPRVRIPNRQARAFSNNKRFTAAGYPRVQGHHGHKHVPGNTHVDPMSQFNGLKLVKLIEQAPHQL